MATLVTVLMSLFWLSAGPLAAPAGANTTGNATYGGFEMDGNFYEGTANTTTATGPAGDPVDWGSDDIKAQVDVVEDPMLVADPTVYANGSKEADLSGWQDAASAQAPGKGDIGNLYVYDRLVSGSQYLYLGFERESSTGSVTYFIELNQKTNTTNVKGTVVPNRTVGDLRLAVSQGGNGAFEVSSVSVWGGSSFSDVTPPPDSLKLAVNDSAITLGRLPKWTNTTRAEKQFVEVGFNLSALGVNLECPSTGFSSAFLRSQAGPEGANPELKDYSTGPISVPSDCSQFKIEKRDTTTTGALLPGATFSISPNPFPGFTSPNPVNVTDGAAGDADGQANGTIYINPAKPGTYTMTEVTPPAGYVGTTVPQTVVAEPYASAPVTKVFVNGLGSLAWTKTDASNGAKICGAAFSLDRAKDAAGKTVNEPAVSIVDRCSAGAYTGNDEDFDSGEFLVSRLKTGTYELKEISAPTGYTADSSAVKVVVISTTTTVSAGTFTNTRRTVDVTLPKVFEGGAADGVGAGFTLYKDSNADGKLSATEAVDGISVATSGGKAVFTGLAWGPNAFYVIEETSVPAGFSAVPNIAFNLATFPEGGTLLLSTVTDPRKTVTVTLPKSFEGETPPYSVRATFTLYTDTNKDGVLDANEKSAGGPTAITSTSGVATWPNLAWGTNAYYIASETTVPVGFTKIADIAFNLTTYPIEGTYDLAAALHDGKPYVDTRRLASVDLKKYGANLTGEPSALAGSTFKLCSETGTDASAYNATDDIPCIAPTSGAGSATMTWSGLAWGSGKVYWLVEVSAPSGYLKVNPLKVGLSSFPDGGTQTVTTTDPRDTVTIDLTKQDGGPTTGTAEDNSPLSSAGFTLFLESGATPGYQALQDTVVVKGPEQVGGDGVISWSGVTWGPERVYYAVETTVPSGYLVVDPQKVDLTTFSANGKYSIGTLVDERLPFQVELTKFDSGYGTATPIALAGAGFTLYSNADCDLVIDTGDVAIGSEHVSTATGTVAPFTGLAWGRCYLLSETTVPSGYDKVTNILVDSRSGYPTGGRLTYDANDPRLLARIDVVKHDGGVNGPALAGATFVLLQNNMVVQGPKQTGVNGAVSFTGLEWGKLYVLRETIAPVGYDLVADRTVDLTNYPIGGVVSLDVADPKLPAAITLVKKDGFDGADLAGAAFTMYAESGAVAGFQPAQDTTVAGGPASMVDGKIVFTGLEWGSGKVYYAVETTTPVGYDTVAPIKVPLTAYPEGGTYAIGRVVDDRSPVTLNLIKQGTSPGGDANVSLAGVGFTLYRDNGTVGVLDAADVAVGTEKTTSTTGAASWTGLTWGAGQLYLLHESTPRPGYATVADRAVNLTSYPAAGQGTVSYTLVDVRQRADLTLRKTAGETNLAGGVFDLYRDNGDGQFNTASDTVVNGCTTLATGLCSITVDWGSSYFWYEKTAPAGYNLPTQQWQGPISVTAANVTTAFATTTFADTKTGITTTPSSGPVVINPQPGTSDSVKTVFDAATLTGLSRDATGTVTFQLFGPFASGASVTCDSTPVFTSSANPISLVSATGVFVATSAVFTPTTAGLYQWRATYTGDAKNVGVTGGCPDATEQTVVKAGPGPQVTKIADPASGSVVQPDGSIAYTVTVSNVGDVPIVNGPVVDTLPGGVTAVVGSISSGGVLSADGRTITWSVNLAAKGSEGASKQLTYRVTVNADAPRGADLVNRVVFLDQQATTTHRTPTGDLTIVKTNGPTGAVAYGDSITYTLKVTASGSLTQTGVVVTDFVPGYNPGDTTSLKTTLTANSAVCDAGTCTVGYDAVTKQLSWQLGSIAGGSSRTVSFTVTVDRPAAAADGSIAAGQVRNAGVVGSTQSPLTPSNVVVNPVTAVPPTPTGALTIVKTNGPTGAVAYGDSITYTLKVTASGSLTQTGVVVTDFVPGYNPGDTTSLKTTLTANSAVCDAGTCTVGYDAVTKQLSWRLGSIAGGSSRTVSFTVTVDRPAAAADGSIARGDVRNAAVAQSVQTPPTPSNVVVNPVTAVPPTPTGALTIVKANDPTTSVAYGDSITYTLKVSASGNLTQTGVVVTDFVPGYDPADSTSLPTTFAAGSARCDGQCAVAYDEATHRLSWSLGDMAAGTSRTVSFTVSVDQAGAAADGSIAPGEVRNAGTVRSTQSAATRSNQVINPVTAVLGRKLVNPPPAVAPPAAAPVALPRTGPIAPVGGVLWWAAMLITVGLGLTITSTRLRRRAAHRG